MLFFCCAAGLLLGGVNLWLLVTLRREVISMQVTQSVVDGWNTQQSQNADALEAAVPIIQDLANGAHGENVDTTALEATFGRIGAATTAIQQAINPPPPLASDNVIMS